MPKFTRFLLFFAAIFLIPIAVFSFDWPDFWYVFYQRAGFSSFSGAGDVDGDGKPDFIVADPDANFGIGSVFVYSGANGNLLYQKNGAALNDWFGYSVAAAGDVDGDGKSDFIIGAPYTDPNGLTDAGSAYIYSGATGSLTYQIDGTINGSGSGSSIAGGYDVDGDGTGDFVIGAPANSGSQVGSVAVYSGANGSFLYRKSGNYADWYGYSVAMVSHLGPDSLGAVLVGAPRALGMGVVYAYGGDGGLIYQKVNGQNGAHFGWSISDCGDLNHDGKSDFIVGEPFSGLYPLANVGDVVVFSGADGSPLFYPNYGSRQNEYLGASVTGIGDANGDGHADYALGGTSTSSGFVYSGANGALIFAPQIQQGYGYSVSRVGDLNGDGRSEFILASSGTVQILGLVRRHVEIVTVSDLPNDQGRQAVLRWQSFPGVTDSLMDLFIVYMRLDSNSTFTAKKVLTPDANQLPPGDWAQVAVVAATGDSAYTTIVPTLGDSTSEGKKYSVYFVRGRSINPLLYIDSPIDSGYSIDNLVPSAPASLVALGTCQGNNLSFSQPVDPDFRYFKIYRDSSPGFSAPVVVGNSTDTSFTDTAPVNKKFYYRVTAIDFSGNEGGPSPQASALAGFKGDLNIDGSLAPADVVILLNAVFLSSSFPAPFCTADVNCDNNLTPADVVVELNAVFLAQPFPCNP